MTKRGETTNMEVKDFIEAIEKFIGPAELDYVIVNNGIIDDEIVAKYKIEENKKPVKIKNILDFADKKYKIIERNVVSDEDFVRHDPEKLAKILQDIIDGWIK